MRSINFEFEELSLNGQMLFAHGFAEIEYSGSYSGFVIRDVTLYPYAARAVQASDRLDTNSAIRAAIIKALEQNEMDAILDAIREDSEARDAEYREERGRPMLAAE